MKQHLCILVLVLTACANAQWTIVNLHPAGATESRALGVGGGQQAGWAAMGGFGHASLWSGTSASWVDLHPGGNSGAIGVGGGQQVGWAEVGTHFHASLWNGTAGSWLDLHPAGAHSSFAYGVSGGQQVGLAHVGVVPSASLWSGTAASWVDLHPAGALQSEATGVSGGQQVGGARFAGVMHACLWTGTAASRVDLHPAGSTGSQAFGVHGGQQVGYADVGGAGIRHASLWSGTTASWVDLNPAGSIGSQAFGVHGGQQVGVADVGGTAHAGLWSGTAASWVDLHAFLPSGFSSSFAQGISHDGGITYVVGYGYNSTTGHDEALMWVSRAVAPTSYSMFRGSVFSGNLASLQNSDDDRLVMRPGITLGSGQPPIQIILNATAPTASPDGFSFSLESSASFGSAQQKISLHNFITGLDEELDARLAKTTDDTVTVTVRTNPSRFIEPGTLAIRALVSFRAVGPSLAFPWSGRIDKAWWNFPG